MKLETLSNGLRVALVPCEAESVAVGLFVESGSRHETAKTSGISHFIEHMLFKGTPTRRPIDLTRAIEGRGGNFNACTSEEATCYHIHLPSDYLDVAVDLLSDMYLNATISDVDFAREKNVVLEEIKMYSDEPSSVVLENLKHSLFPESTLGVSVAGSAASIMPMKAADLRRYVASHYRADNTFVVIVGNFDEAQALKEVSKRFRFRPSRRRADVTCDNPLSGKVIAETKVSKDVAQTQLALGYRAFGVRDDRRFAATVLDTLLGRGMSSRLFQEVREKRGLSYDVSSQMSFFSDAGMFTVTAGLDASKAKQVLATVDKELKRVCEKPVSAAELKRTKEFLIGNFRLCNEQVRSKMFFFGQMMLSYGRLVTPQEQIERIKAVTSADIQSTAKAIFRPANRSVSWVVSK